MEIVKDFPQYEQQKKIVFKKQHIELLEQSQSTTNPGKPLSFSENIRRSRKTFKGKVYLSSKID